MNFDVDKGEIFGFLGPSGVCDRVAFIVNGEIKALDSPHNLIMQKGAAKVSYTYFNKQEKRGEYLLAKMSEDLLLKKLIRENRLTSIHSSEPNLNDIFLDVTGRALQ
jgi:fluoroquinolone transport system ATP-binding protein